ncbi:hypothetical protein QTI51_22895 [Variovorax sp. J22G73]|uniref:hypothetical protein n=1 Tax=unclassified Variovorax TaxID=663243 RepID=UPI002578442E|nr:MULTISPECIES: hypothetical protein [unclassified Variovorax]MDM0007488.1 hypothetical protein [Variovorax sp. J22R203]MDM0100152.1 hypothetical protein [Variovorax sp. J22G73]
MDTSASPSVATDPEAASDEAVLSSCEGALDETIERLLAYIENSGSWMETVLLTMGFYLLSVAVKAPEEFEILGVKINVVGDYREVFLFLIGLVLVSRLVQGWVMWKVHVARIDLSFTHVSSKLQAAKNLLIRKANENLRLAEKLHRENASESQLPDPDKLFADNDMHPLMDAASASRGIPLTAETFREAFADQILSHRNDLVARQLDDRYPIDEWNRAQEAAIAESWANHAHRFAPQVVVSVFDEREEATTTISADKNSEFTRAQEVAKRIALAKARETAFTELRTAMSTRSSAYEGRLDASSKRLRSLTTQSEAFLGKVNFYRRMAKFGHIFHLVLPTLAAFSAAVAVVFHRF